MHKNLMSRLKRWWFKVTCSHLYVDETTGYNPSYVIQTCKRCGTVSLNPFHDKTYER